MSDNQQTQQIYEEVTEQILESELESESESESEQILESELESESESESEQTQETEIEQIQETKSEQTQETKSEQTQETEIEQTQETESEQTQETKSEQIQETKSEQIQEVEQIKEASTSTVNTVDIERAIADFNNETLNNYADIVKINTSDNVLFYIPKEIAMYSGMLATIFDPKLANMAGDNTLPVELKEIDAETMLVVVKYMKYKQKYWNCKDEIIPDFEELPIPKITRDPISKEVGDRMNKVLIASNFLDI